MPRVSEEHKELRRRQILNAARRCFAAEGYQGTTLAKLEEASGISRGGIFHYFADKQSLFVAVAGESSDRLIEIWASGGFRALLEAIVDEDPDWLAVQLEAMSRVRHDPDLGHALAARDPVNDARRRQRLEALEGTLRDDIPLEDVVIFLSVVANGLGLRRIAGDAIPAIDTLVDLVEAGVRPVDAAETSSRTRRAHPLDPA